LTAGFSGIIDLFAGVKKKEAGALLKSASGLDAMPKTELGTWTHLRICGSFTGGSGVIARAEAGCSETLLDMGSQPCEYGSPYYEDNHRNR